LQNLEPLQEEAFKVIEELEVMQGIVKQETQYNVEKLKNPITTQIEYEILVQEVQ
jgi:hypothetical protein